jgi:aryl-alcohol dehydrogenase-like predicted oxidoreductase
VVRGSKDDVLSRFATAAELTAADVVVRLTGDCPLIDPAIVDRVIGTLLANPALQYVSNTINRTYPRGMDVEAVSRTALDEAHRRAVRDYDREHVTPFIKHALEGTSLTVNVACDQPLNRYRITVDYLADFESVKALIESGLPDYSLATLLQRAFELGLDLREAEWQLMEHGNPLDRFGLGAAQFGMNYGRFNVHGKPSNEQLEEILLRARDFGLTLIDTAHLYGDSEMALGCCGERLQGFEVVTKTPRFSDEAITAQDAAALRAAFGRSLRHLRMKSVNGLLIHHAPNLLAPGGERLYQEMLELKREGLVERIGVSVYSGEIAEEIHSRFPMDLVQLPMNVLDQRPIASGTLQRLAAAGVRIQVRSAFLQGLLLAEPNKLGAHFEPVRPVLEKFHAAASAAGVSAAHAALHFLLGRPEIDRVIVGVESPAQLAQLFACFPPAPRIDYTQFAIDDPVILNPALWPK